MGKGRKFNQVANINGGVKYLPITLTESTNTFPVSYSFKERPVSKTLIQSLLWKYERSEKKKVLIMIKHKEFWYPDEKRKVTVELNLDENLLKGDLIIEGITLRNLPNLKVFVAHNMYEKFKRLDIINCPQIKEIDIGNNHLTNLEFLDNLDFEKLTKLVIGESDFPSQDLSKFSKFENLENLDLRNTDTYGNLESLKNLTKLKRLDITGTDVDQEFLKELIEKKIELTRFKELEEDSPDYDEKCEKYGKECRKIKKEMKKKLGSEDMNEVRRVIKDCKKIARWQIELEKKLDSKQLLLGEKNQASQITNYYDNNHQKSEKKLVSYHDQIIQKLTDNEQNIVEPILEEKPVGRGGFAEVYRGK
ncbi:hypothetical protein C1645_744742 [Glomus cerebriforme]|uniref:Uncharacterized protein n=1 Tax=Glomus cerebriforme TaxID=658196 RepID=A0A397S6M1_9GLOM|nr:hypothetical protein C1645_744742 [Glomus cerebriforme]